MQLSLGYIKSGRERVLVAVSLGEKMNQKEEVEDWVKVNLEEVEHWTDS